MSYNEERINNLSVKLNSLIRRHKDYTEEIKELRTELQALKDGKTITSDAKVVTSTPTNKNLRSETAVSTSPLKPDTTPSPLRKTKPTKKKESNFNWEKFIGENLISKIGILIIIIGVAIGTKYSIDNGLLSPLTRIILGYIVGIALLGVGFKLKQKYPKYSAVLVSGAMVINYFVTFIAYGLFGLFPKEITFGLMVIFTIFTVLASWNYKKQVIAVIGLVGAYATPFLLSDGTGEVSFLFAYVAIINIGILAVAIKQDWKLVNYLAFFFTWAIYAAFYAEKFVFTEHFRTSFFFVTLFFLIFYVTFLINKFLKEEQFKLLDVLLVTANSFAFFGFGYALLAEHPSGENYLGLFTLFNGVIHFVVSLVIYKKKLIDPAMTDYIIGLVLVFVTIAIPVQLDGNWVTLLWSFIALALFFVGRWKDARIYEILAYPILALGVGSLLQDWGDNMYYEIVDFNPVLNITFFTSLLIIVIVFTMLYIDQGRKLPSVATNDKSIHKLIAVVLATLAVLLPFVLFFREIAIYLDTLYNASEITITENDYTRSIWNTNLSDLKNTWLMIYSLVFVLLLTILNRFIIKSRDLLKVTTVINSVVIFAFLAIGLFGLSELRNTYLNQYNATYFDVTHFNLVIRYVALVVLVLLVVMLFLDTKTEALSKLPRSIVDVGLACIILWVLTSELIHWVDLNNPEKAYKLGVSILWGVFALGCVSVGIFKKKTHLRIGGMILFAITLIKLFVYDIAHLSSIKKVIVFMILGVLLLIVSFLYNKFKDRISNEEVI